STRYHLKLEGFSRQNIEVEPAGILSGPKLLVNGQPAPKGERYGQMLLRRDDGRDAVVRWRPQLFGLDIPQLYVDGQIVNVVEPLPWYVWVWSALPVLMVLVGGALGALAGFIAFAINTRVFRSPLPLLGKFSLTLLVSLASGVVYLAAATA